MNKDGQMVTVGTEKQSVPKGSKKNGGIDDSFFSVVWKVLTHSKQGTRRRSEELQKTTKKGKFTGQG